MGCAKYAACPCARFPLAPYHLPAKAPEGLEEQQLDLSGALCLTPLALHVGEKEREGGRKGGRARACEGGPMCEEEEDLLTVNNE